MNITPVTDHILLDMRQVKRIGDLDVSSKKTVAEYAEVLAIGKDVKAVKAGDKIFVKAWGVDICKHEGEEYFFVAESTNAICAVIT